ncbi:MAG: YqhA family protein [Bacteroidota bacterium]
MFKKLLVTSRFSIIVAVFGLLVASLCLLINGVFKIYEVIASMFVVSYQDKDMLVGFIESADLFLLAVALYIIAIGLYDLFIDPEIDMPEWLNIRSLADLKKKLLDVIIVILGVIFLGKVVKWQGGIEILYLGGGIALVIVALTYFGKGEK